MHRLILILIAIFLFACTNDEVVVPADIISQEEMVQILAEMHIADASINYKSLSDTVKLSSEIVYSQVLNKYSIAPEKYRKSYQFYLNHPILFNKMYDQVINELSRRQSETQSP